MAVSGVVVNSCSIPQSFVTVKCTVMRRDAHRAFHPHLLSGELGLKCLVCMSLHGVTVGCNVPRHFLHLWLSSQTRSDQSPLEKDRGRMPRHGRISRGKCCRASHGARSYDRQTSRMPAPYVLSLRRSTMFPSPSLSSHTSQSHRTLIAHYSPFVPELRIIPLRLTFPFPHHARSFMNPKYVHASVCTRLHRSWVTHFQILSLIPEQMMPKCFPCPFSA